MENIDVGGVSHYMLPHISTTDICGTGKNCFIYWGKNEVFRIR
jgi:hypothetical protein